MSQDRRKEFSSAGARLSKMQRVIAPYATKRQAEPIRERERWSPSENLGQKISTRDTRPTDGNKAHSN